MHNLERFITYLCGDFDNQDQIAEEMKNNHLQHPLATHRNHIINDHIDHLPMDFQGYFILEESYYVDEQGTKAQPHLFLFQANTNGNVELLSYEIPKAFNQNTFVYHDDLRLDYSELTLSATFKPMEYIEKEGVFFGESENQFNPAVTFLLRESIGPEELSVKETLLVNGKRTMGYDTPILYKRIVVH